MCINLSRIKPNYISNFQVTTSNAGTTAADAWLDQAPDQPKIDDIQVDNKIERKKIDNQMDRYLVG